MRLRVEETETCARLRAQTDARRIDWYVCTEGSPHSPVHHAFALAHLCGASGSFPFSLAGDFVSCWRTEGEDFGIIIKFDMPRSRRLYAFPHHSFGVMITPRRAFVPCQYLRDVEKFSKRVQNLAYVGTTWHVSPSLLVDLSISSASHKPAMSLLGYNCRGYVRTFLEGVRARDELIRELHTKNKSRRARVSESPSPLKNKSRLTHVPESPSPLKNKSRIARVPESPSSLSASSARACSLESRSISRCLYPARVRDAWVYALSVIVIIVSLLLLSALFINLASSSALHRCARTSRLCAKIISSPTTRII